MGLQKDHAVNFLRSIVFGEIEKVFETYIHPEFRHHNAYFKGDATSLKLAMMENDHVSPDKKWDVKQTVEEGDRVMVHSHIKQNQEDPGAAVVHMFRFQDGKIVEMWDVGQAVPIDSPNENGMF